MNNQNKNTLDSNTPHRDSGVKFQGDWHPPLYEREPPKMVQWIMKYSGGWVKNEKEASYVLAGFVILAIIISFILVFGGGGEESRKEPPPPIIPSGF